MESGMLILYAPLPLFMVIGPMYRAMTRPGCENAELQLKVINNARPEKKSLFIRVFIGCGISRLGNKGMTFFTFQIYFFLPYLIILF